MKDTVGKPRALPNDADTAVDYVTAVATPGALKGSAMLDVHTRQAQALVRGRREVKATDDTKAKFAIVGLVRFGFNMGRLWEAARSDDPYADWFLIRIAEALDEARQDVKDKLEGMERLLNGMSGIHFDVGGSTSPVRVPLHFGTPYGYMGTYLLADFDQLVRAALTAKHVALLGSKKAHDIIDAAGRRVRAAYTLSATWRNFAITRADVRQNTQRAQKAQAVMGALPEDILSGEWRAAVAPEVRKAPVEAVRSSEHADLASVG